MAYYQKKQKTGFNFSDPELLQGVLDSYAIGTALTKNGRIMREIFASSTSAYRVYEVEDGDRRYIVSGKFPIALQIDGYYEFKGKVGEHNGRRQLMVESFHSSLPTTPADIITLLTTLPGLDTRAPMVYAMFGNSVLDVIKNTPEKVPPKVKGISLEMVKKWQQFLLNNEKSEDGVEALMEYGISAKKAALLFEKYGATVVDRIRDNPYFLIQEIPQFGFPKCDVLALKNGCKIDSVERITQAMIYMMKRESMQYGHCYLPLDEFMEKSLRVVNMTLSYRDAQRLIKSSGEENIRVVMGSNKATIDKNSLDAAMKEWQSGTKSQSFYFPIFNVSRESVLDVLNLISSSTFIIEEVEGERRCYLRRYYECEQKIARKVRTMNEYTPAPFLNMDAVIDNVCAAEGVTLEERQYEAGRSICSAPGGIHILTGSAGCGKTFTLNIIIKVLRILYGNLYKGRPFEAKILAPTGKAAKVANLATKLPAMTIHMALGITEEGIVSKSLTSDVVVVDEFSMVDISLGAELFSAISSTTKLIILGDQQQLPSIGPGLVLHDLMASGQIDTTVLNVVKRQGEGSGVLANAERIAAGESIETVAPNENSMDGNSYVIEQPSPELCRKLVINSVRKLVKEYSLDEVQVLCLQHATDVGTDAMNLFLQQELNPKQEGSMEVMDKMVKYKVDGVEHETALNYRIGDKVIHTKNNYKVEWFDEKTGALLAGRTAIINGEMGIISDIQKEGKKTLISVRYDDGIVIYEDDFSELSHAYALTVHKSQGSQWAAVVSPVLNSSRIMLSRNLFYTMLTRAQHTSVVVGDKSAMDYAVQNDQPKKRNTSLPVALTSAP